MDTSTSPATAMSPQAHFPLVEFIFFIGLVLTAACCLSAYSSAQNAAHSELWRSLDAAGVRGRGVVPWTRAILGSVANTAQNARDGYQRSCKAENKPFALPTVWTGRAVVVLPPSLLPVLNQPDGELAAHRAQHETIQLPYMMADREVYDNPIHFDVVRRRLSPRHVGDLAAATAEELDGAFRAHWRGPGGETGGGDGWVTLNNWAACGRVISRAAMRLLVGEPLCRDERLLALSTRYADAVIRGTAIINCLPPFLRTWIGPLLGLPAKYYLSRCLRILKPLVQERTRVWEESKSGAATKETPDDFLQWMVERCAKAGPEQADASRIATRLLALSTMSVMGMVWVLSHCMQDLYRSPSREEFLAGLEEERVRPGGGDRLLLLRRLDSTLRESMRLSGISVVGLARDVAAEELDLGLEGAPRIPRGARVVFPTQSMHTDPDFALHDRPLEFDAFRFSRGLEGEAGEKAAREPAAAAASSSTAPSQSFLAWGYGKHACPGRWYAAQTLKQALAYIVSSYDVEVLGEPREKKSLVNVFVPHTDVEIRVRRKDAR